MLGDKKKIKEVLKEEIQQYEGIGYKGLIHSFLTKCEVGRIVRFQIALRKDEYYSNKKKSPMDLVGKIYWRRRHNILGGKLGISIPINTFDKGLIIYHSQAIVVHRDARIGMYCKLHGMNCIGNNGSDGKTPIIGNCVDIGIGASVIGDVEICDNVRIAAGAVVCKSCSNKGTVLAGIPARELER